MTLDVKDVLSVADGGPVGPPDVDAIEQRARRLSLRRGGTLAGAAVVVIIATIGIVGGFEQLQTPVVGETPEPAPTEPNEVDAPQTGAPMWTAGLDPTVFGDFGSGSQLASSGERVFIASGFTDDAAVVALELATGEQVWRTDLDDSASVQVATDELVIASSRGLVLALDVATGSRLWEHELPNGYSAVSATVDDDTLYLVAGAGAEGDTSPPRVRALDLDEGTVRWSSTLTTGTDPQWTPPAIIGDQLLVVVTPSNPQVEAGNQVHALQLTDGVEGVMADLDGRQGFTSRATAVTGDLLHVQVPGVGVVTLDIPGQSSHLLEGMSLVGAGPSGPLYVTELDESASVRTVDPRTGATLDGHPAWQLEPDWFEVETHVYTSDVLLPSLSGLLAIDSRSGNPAWRHTNPTAAYEVLVLDGLLITAHQDGQIVATPLPNG